jgi:surface antigen
MLNQSKTDGGNNMKGKIAVAMVLLLVAALAATGCSSRGDVGGREVGAVVGGVGGGVLGSQIGEGSGQTAATIGGVLLGAALGGYIGDSWEKQHSRQSRQRMSHALNDQPAGRPVQWRGQRTGHRYEFTPGRTYTSARGRQCRPFTETVWVDGRPESYRGTACRRPDGRWEIVDYR